MLEPLAIVVVVVLLLIAVFAVLTVVRSARGKGSFRGRGRGGGRRHGGRRHGGRRHGRGYGGRGWRGGYGGYGGWPWLNAGWWGGDYNPYPYYTPYVTDYANVRQCPSDPTDARELCQGSENNWSVDDRCRAPGLAGDAEYVWRSDEDKKCYSYNP